MLEYELENVERLHRENPRTFSIPRSDQRNNLSLGQLVKLVFLLTDAPEHGTRAERMWVEVKGITEMRYSGSLENQPRYIQNLKLGDVIEFGPEHVAALQRTEFEGQIPYGQYARLHRDMLQPDAWPYRLVREKPEKENDSGWKIWCFHHPSEEGAWVEVSIDDLVGHFRVLDSVLDEPVGTQWLWDGKQVEYRLEG